LFLFLRPLRRFAAKKSVFIVQWCPSVVVVAWPPLFPCPPFFHCAFALSPFIFPTTVSRRQEHFLTASRQFRMFETKKQIPIISFEIAPKAMLLNSIAAISDV
jgi:hypothetical protein